MPFCGADAERDSHLSAAEEKRDGALDRGAATLSTRVAAVEARRTGLARLQTPSIGPEGTERLHTQPRTRARPPAGPFATNIPTTFHGRTRPTPGAVRDGRCCSCPISARSPMGRSGV